MPYYRELHCESSALGRTDGTNSHPQFSLDGPLYVTHFCVRNIQLPMSYDNFYKQQFIGFSFKLTYNGNKYTYGPGTRRTINKGLYTGSEFATLVQTLLKTTMGLITPIPTTGSPPALNTVFDINATTVTVGETGNLLYTFTPLDPAPNTITDVTFTVHVTSVSGAVQEVLRRLLGFGTDNEVTRDLTFIPLVPFTATFPQIRMSRSNYLMLRSSLSTGASYLTNIRGNKPDYESSNIIAKVPIPNEITNYTVFSYQNNDSPSKECMFTFDGSEINNFDLYFTYPYSNDVVDFGDFFFSVTIGVISDYRP